MPFYLSQAGGGAAGGTYSLETIPIYPTTNVAIRSPYSASTQDIFFTGETHNRDLNGSPSCFHGTKGTGWSTVFNHSGKGSLIWFCTTSFNSNTDRVILKLTVDGEVRETDITMSPSSGNNGQARIFCGNIFDVNTNDGITVYQSLQYQGNFGTFEYINSTWTAPYGSSHYVPFSVGGAFTAGAIPLKYETNLKIEIYNSHISTSAAGNRYGGMVVQGY